MAVPVLRMVKGGSGSQMDSYELAKVENGEIENITEEAAEEATPPAEETTQMAAADTAGSETDGISVVETNEAAAQENEQAQESADEPAVTSEEDGNPVDTLGGDALAAEASDTGVVLYEDIKVKILTADVQEDGIYYTAEVMASAYEDAFSVGTTCNLYADTDAQPLVAEQEYTLTLAAGERAECYKIVQ